MRINKKYLLLFLITFLIEVFIALFVRDRFIRPFVGDILVIVLIYAFIKIFLHKDIVLLPFYIFIFAVFIEILQYFNIVELLNLSDNLLVKTILGSTFDIVDILCYFAGMVILFIFQLAYYKFSKKL